MAVSKLQGRKKELFTQIGEQVYELHAEAGHAERGQATCKEVDALEHEIAEKNEQIAKMARPGARYAASTDDAVRNPKPEV